MARADVEATPARHAPAELLQTLIRFDTTNPPGNERACISYIDDLLSEAGLETTIRARDPERPNLIARFAGQGSAPPLLLYGHVDVVTADNQSWREPPFEARVVDGYVWGRGALDMKGGVAMMLAALLRARSEGLSPAGDVLFCALSDEEGFGRYGAKFMVESHAALFEGVRHALGEFGGFTLHLGSRRFYPIQVAEKEICTVRATIRGAAGHGALPIRGGAMARLGKLLRALDRRTLPTHITPVAREMCRSIGAALPPPARALIRALLNPALTDRVLRLMGPRGHTLDPLFHNTVSPTILNASEKVNVIPSEVSVVLDGRLLPGLAPADLIREIAAVAGRDVELELVQHDPGPSEHDMALFDMLGAILSELDPGSVPAPLLMAGVTDARFFSRLGIQTYGYLPMKLPPGFDFWRTIHGADERIPLVALEFGAEALCRALERYGRSDA